MSVTPHGELAPQPGALERTERRTLGPQALPEWVTIPTAAIDQGGIDVELAQYWRLLVKHRWLIVGAVVAALTVGVVVTLLSRPIYTASASLQLDREAAKVVNTEDTATPSEEMIAGDEFFQTQYALLASRSLAIRVAQSLGLTQSDDFIRQMGGNPRIGDRRDQVLTLMSKRLGVTPTRGSRLVTVSFSTSDPALSARVTNAFAEQFITANLDRRFEASSYARDFLEQQLAIVKAKLEASERDVVAYAISHQIIELTQNVQPGDGQPIEPAQQQSLVAANLEALSASLAAAKTARIQAEQNWREAQATPGLGLPQILQSPMVEDLAQKRAELNADYENQLRLFKPDYPAMLQEKAQIDELDRQLDLAAGTIRASLQTQYQAALRNEQELSGQVDTLKGSVLDLRDKSIEYNILQREVDTNRTLYDGLLQRYKEVGVAGGITTNNISIVDRAEPPPRPSSPKPLLNMGLSVLAGLIIGVGLAFVREALDQGVRAPSDIESKIGIPCLGAAPLLEKGIQPAEALADQKSSLTEAYQSIRSALQFATRDGFPKSLLITSARPGEGKSTTAFAIANSLARLGFETLLVDADLRNPSLHKSMGADNRSGLTNALTGAATLPEVVQKSDVPNLFLVTSGPMPPNPAELLSGARLKGFVDDAIASFDMVIIDGPPVMGLADAPSIGAMVTGILLVVEAGHTGQAQARAAIRRLLMANGHLIGAILAMFNSRHASYGYGYGYGYGYEYDYSYGKSEKAKAPRKRGLARILSRSRRLTSK
jgi:polysaccharide biosynthesis transport protein